MLCTDVSRKFDLTNYQLNYIFLGDITENDGKTFLKVFSSIFGCSYVGEGCS